MRLGNFLIGMGLVGVMSAAHGSPVQRSDLTESLNQLICGEQSGIDMPSAWSRGIYTSQMQVELVNTKDRPDLTDAKLKQRAELMAKAQNYGGFAQGSCPEQQLKWLAFAPATVAVKVAGKKISLPMKALSASCQKVEVMAAGREHFHVETLTANKAGEVAMPEGSGTVSVTCSPKQPRWMGRQTWYMVPYGDLAQKAPIPEDSLLKRFGKQPDLALHLWIEAIRKQAGIKPQLIQTQMLSDAAGKLAVGGGISHDLGSLKFVKEKLKEVGVDFLGENRVSAGDIQLAAWLLWYSPRHRQLLLHPKADAIGLSVHETTQNQTRRFFAVITMGDSSQLDVAGKPGNTRLR